SRIDQAARNNAIWCDTVCRAHNIPGEFLDAVWINRQSVPRFYPNVVTLSGPGEAARQRAQIRALMAAGLPGSWGVKDSFKALDLTDLGFHVLLEATWLWRAPFPTTPHRTPTPTKWTWVRSPSELAHWETAWSCNPANCTSAPPAPLFLPGLL